MKNFLARNASSFAIQTSPPADSKGCSKAHWSNLNAIVAKGGKWIRIECSRHPGDLPSLYAAKISYVASAVRFCICVDNFTIETGLRNAEPVIVTHNRRCVHHERDKVAVA